MIRANTIGFWLVSLAVLMAAGLAATGCKPTAPRSTVQAFNSNSLNEAPASSEPMLSITESSTGVVICRLDPQAQAAMTEEMARSNVRTAQSNDSPNSVVSMRVKQTLSGKRPVDFPLCDYAWQSWYMKSVSLGQPAPMDVAGLEIPHLAEVKLGLAGGAMLAGRCGDPVGATTLAVASMMLSYAQDKGWVCSR